MAGWISDDSLVQLTIVAAEAETSQTTACLNLVGKHSVDSVLRSSLENTMLKKLI